MHLMSRNLALFAALLGAVGGAHADVFKCSGLDGKVSFASVPCAPDVGAATWESTTARTKLHSVSAEDAKPQKINEKATEILRTGYNTRIKYTVTIVPDTSGEVFKYDGKQGFNYNTCNRGGEIVACAGKAP
jgi:hypothetical protein